MIGRRDESSARLYGDIPRYLTPSVRIEEKILTSTLFLPSYRKNDANMWSTVFVLFVLLTTCCKTAETADSNDNKKMRIAFCLTGQLARLELLSKIKNIFVANVKAGHTVHLFMLLDNEKEVKQTYWRYDYSGTPYINYNTKKMEDFIEKKLLPYKMGDNFLARVRLEPRSQDEFEVVDGFVPVDRKEVNCQHTVCGRGENVDGVEEAYSRFQNNLSWMLGLRDCVKWMQVLTLSLDSHIPLATPQIHTLTHPLIHTLAHARCILLHACLYPI